MITNNKESNKITCSKQYQKMRRAVKYILNAEMTVDEYYAIAQLMNEIDPDACLILDNTHENI
jgi:hypothetical protein